MSTPCDATSLISGAACLECGIPPGMQAAVTASLLCQIVNNPGFTPHTAQYPLTDGAVLNVNFSHGLGHVPAYLRGVLLSTAIDGGLNTTVGEELNIDDFIDDTGGGIRPFSVVADNSKIYLCYDGDSGGSGSILLYMNGQTLAVQTFTNFSLKVYYQ